MSASPTPRRKKAGHRSWKLRNGVVSGSHTGDIMSVETRSRVMSRISGKNTTPERLVCAELHRVGHRFSCHVHTLPGRPDIVFAAHRLAVFIDGDFWHGWRFPLWRHKLSNAWQEKIHKNRARDQRNFRKLRNSGWTVVRIWEHQIEQDLCKCIARICAKISEAQDEVN